MDGRKLLSVRQVAEYVGVHPKTVYKAVKDGALVPTKPRPDATGRRGRPKNAPILRFRPISVDAWIETA